MTENSNYKSNLFYSIAFGLIGLYLFIFVWGLNKGLDITDEGFYLLNIEIAKAGITNLTSASLYQFLAAVYIPSFMSDTVLKLRSLNIVIILLALITFLWVYYHYIKKYKGEISKKKLLLFILVGMISIYYFLIYHPNNLSYNSLNLVFIVFTVSSFVLCILAKSKTSLIFLFITAYFLNNVFYIKITSFLLILIVLIIILIIQKKYSDIVLFILSIFITQIVLLYLTGLNINDVMSFFRNTRIEYHSPYSIKSQIVINSKFIISYTIVLGIGFLFSRVIRFLSLTFQKNNLKKKLQSLSLFVLSFFLIIILFREWGNFVTVIFATMLFPFNINYSVFKSNQGFQEIRMLLIQKYNTKKDYYLIYILILIVPIIGAAGSAGLFPLSSIVYLGFIAVPATFTLLRQQDRYYSKILLVIVLLFMIRGEIETYVLNPYPFTIPAKTEYKSEMPEFKRMVGINVDEGFKAEAENIYTKLSENGYNKGDLILGFYEIPGLIYMYEAKPIIIWQEYRTDEYIGKLIDSRSKSFFVIYDRIDMRNKPFGVSVDEICDKIGKKEFILDKIYESEEYYVFKAKGKEN